MKIAFVYPGYENLGIEYLSSALRKEGHQTRLFFDLALFNDSGGVNIPLLARCFNNSKKMLKELSGFRPQLVCFSCGTDNFRWALEMAKMIKADFSVPVVFGGPHPTSVPERVLEEPAIDFVCLGEGEEAITELAGELESGSGNRSIKNIWFKDKNGIIRNEIRALRDDLDSLPFPDKELYYKKYGAVFKGYAIITSRGCPHSCTYCLNSVLRDIYRDKGRYLRRRSPENVTEELFLAKDRYRPKFIHFCDEVFTCDKEWLKNFIRLYKKNINLPFACYISPSFADAETAGLLKEGGCYKAQMGVQTVDENRREGLLGRRYANREVSAIIKNFNENGIYLTCDNIFGLPGEGEKELEDTVRFYLSNRPDHIEVFWLKYYPRTPIVGAAKKMGLLDDKKIKDIEGGVNTVGIARGGDTYKAEFSRFQLFLNLLRFLPKQMSDFILKKKIYRFFPRLRPMFITVFFRIFNRAKYDFYTSFTFRRYFYFMRGRT